MAVFQQGKPYVVDQVILKEALVGVGSNEKTMRELEDAINERAYQGYVLKAMSTAPVSSKGVGGGDRVLATLVFELNVKE